MFLRVLEDAVERMELVCHAYCLMPNHYHLLLETPMANLSRAMRQVNGIYAQRFNRRHARAGHVFQGRFKAILVEKEAYLLELTRYVVSNPVRAGLVRRHEDWRWSSYQATAGSEPPPRFLCVEWILSQFGTDWPRAINAYRRFVARRHGTAMWNDLHAGFVLATDAFIAGLDPHLQPLAGCIEFPKRQRRITRPSLGALFESAGDRRQRNLRIQQAAHTYGYRLSEIAEHLGLHYSTISGIATRVKKDLGTPESKT